MNIVLIGAGNLATNLGIALRNANHTIMQVWSRTHDSADTLAAALDSEAITQLEHIRHDADVYIFAIKDAFLKETSKVVAGILNDINPLFVHTAGSMPLDTLSVKRRAVLYPMQTFSRSRVVDFSNIPCFLEGETRDELAVVRVLAESVSDNIHELSSADRRYLHLSAVFVCNFVNHCYRIGADILEEHNIPFSTMLPLIDETARKVHELHPREAQTGPAVRWDENVIARHMSLLSDGKRTIYELLSKSIYDKL